MSAIFSNQEISYEVLKYLDFNELLNFAKVSQDCKKLVFEESLCSRMLWKDLAKKMGYDTGNADSVAGIKEIIKKEVVNLQNSIRKFPQEQIPADIQNLIENREFTELKIAKLKDFRLAMDTLYLWKSYTEKIYGYHRFPSNLFTSSDSVIKHSQKFPAWVRTNMERIKQALEPNEK